MKTIIHISSAHTRSDQRIFFKQILSLRKNGYKVIFIVADGKGNSRKKNLEIYDVGCPKNRLNRIIVTCNKIYNLAKNLKGDIYHIHDPELIRIGLKLIKLREKVIFDSHEDVESQILSKYYLSRPFQIIISKIYRFYENIALSKFTGIIAATPYIKKKLSIINKNIIDICNYPKVDEFKKREINKHNNKICYVGSISKKRGIFEIVKSLEYNKGKIFLNLAGKFSPNCLLNELKKEAGWKYVNYYGFVNRKKTNKIFNQSNLGVVTLHPTAAYIHSLPVKMFEYMACGLPVLASNFSLFKKIINQENCGKTVDPYNPEKIAMVSKLMLNDKKKKYQKNGINAVKKKYNWKFEEKKLINFYRQILNVKAHN